MMKRVPVGVVGASGYSGIELLRILLEHPVADLVAVTSRQQAGRGVAEVFPRFAGHPVAQTLEFTSPPVGELGEVPAEVWFLALPHGVAAEYARALLDAGRRVIDLSADFRLRSAETYRAYYGNEHPAPDLLAEAVYGFPEIRGGEIRGARLVASPGCYPTSIILPLRPLLEAGLVDREGIVVASMSGVSGAGRKEALPLLFAECNESVRAYGAPRHRHLAEIEEELSLAAGGAVQIVFTPHLVPVTQGICTTAVGRARPGTKAEAVARALESAYAEAPFVRLLGEGRFPDTRNVVRTNRLDIGWVVDARTGTVQVFSAVDNLWKGAASQAVQSFNLMIDVEESAGLAGF